MHLTFATFISPTKNYGVLFIHARKKPQLVKRGIFQVNKAYHAEDCWANPEAAYHNTFSLISGVARQAWKQLLRINLILE